jgi:hypothetical protein
LAGGSGSDVEVVVAKTDKPHIVFLLADDLGWNSIGYEDFDLSFATPFLTGLAKQGIIMDSYYAQEVCTPARAAILTGLVVFARVELAAYLLYRVLARGKDEAWHGPYMAAGKARLVMFHPHMQEQLHDRLRLEQDIDMALARNEFFVEFQPVVDLTSRELLGLNSRKTPQSNLGGCYLDAHGRRWRRTE